MKWSWKLGEVAGIGIFVHWTFPLIIAWVIFQGVGNGETAAELARGVALVLAIFACVVLHELGHALTAKRFGVRTRDITLLPIGGVARLERIPEDPVQEFWIAIAGPAVNVAIAAVLFVVLIALGGAAVAGFDIALKPGEFLFNLLLINVFLVVFNLLPAFPMDGGRVLRAAIAHFSGDYVRATQIAANVGQMMAIAFGIVGLFGIPGVMESSPFLIFIALFVYLGAQEEAHMVQMRSLVRGVPVREAMMTRIRALSPDDPLWTAVDELRAGGQQDFPVVDNGRVVGMLARQAVIKTLHEGDHDSRVRDMMQADCGTVEDGEMLDKTFMRMRAGGCSSLPVVHDGRLVGLVTLENVGELMLIHSGSPRGRARSKVDDVFGE